MRRGVLLAVVLGLGVAAGGCGGGSGDGNRNEKITPNLTAGGQSTVPAGGQTGTTTP